MGGHPLTVKGGPTGTVGEMALPDDDRLALVARLAPAGGAAANVVADAVDDGEELREILVDAQGDVVAFTSKRALFVADGAAEPVVVGYDEVEVRQRDAGLAIDALIEGGRLILDVARGTFARLAVVGAGGPPGRATWLPVRSAPAPVLPSAPPVLPSTPPLEPLAAPAADPVLAPPSLAELPPPTPRPTLAPPLGPPPAFRPNVPPPGWHPDPSRLHWWRWWDGQDWTDHVADGGPPSIDPLPPR